MSYPVQRKHIVRARRGTDGLCRDLTSTMADSPLPWATSAGTTRERWPTHPCHELPLPGPHENDGRLTLHGDDLRLETRLHGRRELGGCRHGQSYMPGNAVALHPRRRVLRSLMQGRHALRQS